MDSEYSLLPDARPADDGTIAEVERSPWIARVLGSVMMIGVGCLCVVAALALSQTRHWSAWLTLFLLVEPLMLFSFAAAVFLIAPRSWIGRVFAFALRRVKIALALVVAGWALLLLGMVVYVAIEMWKTWGPFQ